MKGLLNLQDFESSLELAPGAGNSRELALDFAIAVTIKSCRAAQDFMRLLSPEVCDLHETWCNSCNLPDAADSLDIIRRHPCRRNVRNSEWSDVLPRPPRMRDLLGRAD